MTYNTKQPADTGITPYATKPPGTVAADCEAYNDKRAGGAKSGKADQPLTRLEFALMMIDKGFGVFPITWTENGKCSCGDDGCKKLGKHPLKGSRGFKDATTGVSEAREAWGKTPGANFGVYPGAQFVVIDLDRKSKDEDGQLIDGLENLADHLGVTPAELLHTTFTVSTPNGGYHLYYSTPEGCEGFASSTGRLADGVDVRAVGGYVVGPGSDIHGKAYEVINDVDIAALPDSLETALSKPMSKSENAQEWLVDPDLPRAIEEARRYLKQAKPAVEGEGGDDHTYKVAASVRDLGVSEEKCLELMTEDDGWNDRCSPPWSLDELKSPVSNAYQYASKPAGSAYLRHCGFLDYMETDEAKRELEELDAWLRRQVVPPATEPTRRLRLLGISELSQLPDPEWLVEGLMEEKDLAMVYGPSGSLKSFLMLDVSLALAASVNVLPKPDEPGSGLKTAAGCPVVYCAGEGAVNFAKKRIPAWLKARGIPKSDLEGRFFLTRAVPQMSGKAPDLDVLIEEIERMEASPGLIVIDTVSMATAGTDENSASDMALFMNNCRKLIEHFGCAVAVVHHTGHETKRGARGSSAFLANMDGVLEVSAAKDSEPVIVTVKVIKLRDADPGEVYTARAEKVNLGGDRNSLALWGAEKVVEPSFEVPMLAAAMTVHSGSFTLAEFVEIMKDAGQLDQDLKDETASKRIKRLLKDEEPEKIFGDDHVEITVRKPSTATSNKWMIEVEHPGDCDLSLENPKGGEVSDH